MRSCEHCGTPLHESWDHCRRCGADLPPQEERPARRPRLPAFAWAPRGRVPAPFSRAAAGLRGLRPSSEAFDRFRGRLVPAWTLVATFVVLTLVGLAIAAASGGDGVSAAELEAARLAESEALAERDQTAADLTTARTESDALSSKLDAAEARVAELEEEIAGGEGDLEALQTEVDDLQEQLDGARGDLEATEETIATRDAQIDVLIECVDGLQVGIAFATQGRLDLARRAIEAVQGACGQVQSFE